VNGESASLHPTSWHTAATALRLPGVRSSIARVAGVEPHLLRVGTTGEPQSAVITVYGEGATPEQAILVANSAATATVGFLRQVAEGAISVRSGFALSSESWDLGSGVYVLRPSVTTHRRSPAHGGPGSLEVLCNSPVSGGCGPYVRIEGAFRKGETYDATGWIKAPPKSRIRLVLGSTPNDVAVGAQSESRAGWQRLAVSWIPHNQTSTAVAAFQLITLGQTRFIIDDVSVAQRKTAGRHRAGHTTSPEIETLLPATSARRHYEGSTGAWAAGGAGAGLLIGLAGVAAAEAARRRRRDVRGPDRGSLS
jgi:hypothetical protein